MALKENQAAVTFSRHIRQRRVFAAVWIGLSLLILTAVALFFRFANHGIISRTFFNWSLGTITGLYILLVPFCFAIMTLLSRCPDCGKQIGPSGTSICPGCRVKLSLD